MQASADSTGIVSAGVFRPSVGARLGAVVLALLTIAAVVFAVVNFQQRTHFTLPTDGVAWWDTPGGVVARQVGPNSPAAKAGIEQGDVLIAVNGTPVTRATGVTRDLYRAGLWTELSYRVLRNGTPLSLSVVTQPAPKPLTAENYLRLVGLAYLLIGLFVLWRRWNAPHAIHFYLFCLVSFILYSFHYSGKLSAFDQEVYWANVVALLLQPALLAHFAMVFPRRARSSKLWPGLIYLLPAGLLALHASVAEGLFGFTPWLGSRVTLDQIELAYLGILTLAAATVFYWSYRRSQPGLVRQQLKVATVAVAAGGAPFFAIYIVPYALGVTMRPWMDLSVFFLALVPIGFAYAIIRYRLMDVDILFQRGLAHTAATAGLVAAYFALVGAIGMLFHSEWTTGPAGVVLAIVAAAFLFQPVRDWVQQRLDRFFYRDRLDYRATLLEFGRTLTTEVRLEPMLSRLLDRVSQALLVDRLAIFAADPDSPAQFTVARSQGVEWNGSLDLAFLGSLAGARQYLFFESADAPGLSAEERRTVAQLGLNYFIGCRVHDRTVAVLGLGKTVDGEFLTTDDLSLLFTMAGYIAIAIENARLYHSLEREAAQIERLKDFSENIVESLSVGVLTTDLDSRIESWNTFLERRIGVSRNDAVGRLLEEVFPPELAAEIALASQPDRSIASVYKFPLHAGRADLIVNIALAPLMGKNGERLGLLILLDDITERIRLEDQMRQNEKLSSLGLLAAGVAHEVNTPLAVISNYAQMLARQMDRDDPRQVLVDKIVKQTFRASEITSNLLNFSRTASSEFSDVDLNTVIQDTLALVRHPLASSHVEVELLLDSDLPAIFGNANRLQQVFLNLFLNARDAMPSGGRLTVVSSRSNSHIEVHVSDTGHGIRPEHMGRVFDPFFTTKRPGRGTGLGLAVSYGIIQEHAGKVEIHPGAGGGTTFRLEFPASRKTVHA
jgi:two-component system NtrC family sensor kinase